MRTIYLATAAGVIAFGGCQFTQMGELTSRAT